MHEFGKKQAREKVERAFDIALCAVVLGLTVACLYLLDKALF